MHVCHSALKLSIFKKYISHKLSFLMKLMTHRHMPLVFHPLYHLSLLDRADSRLAPSQWETSLQSNAVSHWLGASLESALSKYSPMCPILTSGAIKAMVPSSCPWNSPAAVCRDASRAAAPKSPIRACWPVLSNIILAPANVNMATSVGTFHLITIPTWMS